MKKIYIIIYLVTLTPGYANAKMPLSFCKELKGISNHISLAYKDTKAACIWDYDNPRRKLH